MLYKYPILYRTVLTKWRAWFDLVIAGENVRRGEAASRVVGGGWHAHNNLYPI